MGSAPVLRGLAAIPAVRRLIELAFDEDLGRGDVTSSVVVGAAGRVITAEMVAREPIVVFGVDVVTAVFSLVEPACEIAIAAPDGTHLEASGRVMTVRGPAAGILTAERTALNFIQRLSGVATLARRYAQAVEGTRARVIDTRKTTPGFRVLEKAAVVA